MSNGMREVGSVETSDVPLYGGVGAGVVSVGNWWTNHGGGGVTLHIREFEPKPQEYSPGHGVTLTDEQARHLIKLIDACLPRT